MTHHVLKIIIEANTDPTGKIADPLRALIADYLSSRTDLFIKEDGLSRCLGNKLSSEQIA